jgi:hypothetical protein
VKDAPRGDVFDLNAAVEEALGDPFPFEYGTPVQIFQLDHPQSVDYRDLAAADGGDLEAVRSVVSMCMDSVEAGQWERFDALAMPMVGLDRLFRAWLAFYGIEPGKLADSSSFAGATGQPSNRASRRSMARG